MRNIPRPGDIFYPAKDKPYQVITIGIHKETCETMVIYQALFGDFRTYVLPLSKFMNEMQENTQESDIKPNETDTIFSINDKNHKGEKAAKEEDKVNHILLSFLDADSYAKKLEIIASYIKSIDDRLINSMAASIDCTIEDGPIDKRLQELIYCLKQMSRFEDRRLR